MKMNKGLVAYSWHSLTREAERSQYAVGRTDLDISQTVIQLVKDNGNGWFSYVRRHAMIGEIGRGCIKLYKQV